MKDTPLQQATRLLCAITLTITPAIAFAQTNTATPGTVSLAAPEIRTPKAAATPRINGPAIFGVRPGNPFLYHIPATGERPMTFSVSGLPDGLNLDAQTGNITGSIAKPGDY